MEPTHFSLAHGTYSSIDMTICSPNIADLFEWTVHKELYNSDHFPIIINELPNFPLNTTNTPTLNLTKANWHRYKQCMPQQISHLVQPAEFIKSDIHEIVETFNELIINTANHCIPSVTRTPFKRRVPWWNSDCRMAIASSHKAYYQFKRRPTEENRLQFLQARAKARRIVKQSKKESWLNFVKTLNSQTASKTIWTNIQKIRGRFRNNNTITLQNPETKLIISHPQSVTDLLADTFASASSDSNYEEEFRNFKNNSDTLELQTEYPTSSEAYNDTINFHELEDALSTCRSSSSGPDNIPYELLKQMPPEGKRYLLEIYNFLWTNKVFPDQWRSAIVVPIPKPNKDLSMPSNYRPIALTCTMCKVLEKIVNKRLRWILENRNIFSEAQKGFRQFCSTTDNLLILESEIQEAFNQGQHLLVVSLDIEKAYDMTWRTHILKTLQEHHITGNLLCFINNFLQNRTIRVRANNTISKQVNIQNGVPQGSVLSVTLFLLAINKILHTVSLPVKGYLFADDLTVFCKGNNISTTEALLQDTITQIQTWTSRTGFKFSQAKSKCICFTKSPNNIPNPTIYLQDKPIETVNNIKILGLTFDQKLTWKIHITNLTEDCRRRLNILKTIAYRNWGADYHVLQITYHTVIRSKLDYGAIVYNSASSSVLQKLNTIHNSALRIVLGAYRTSPIQSILMEASEPPLDIRRIQQSIKYGIKVAARPHSNIHPYVFPTSERSDSNFRNPKLTKPFHLRLQTYLNTYNIVLPAIMTRDFYEQPPWQLKFPEIITAISNHLKTNTSSATYKSLFREVSDKFTNYHFIYTDGSKTDQGTGCAAILPDVKLQYKLPDSYSIYSSELYAIYRALSYVISSRHNRYTICSDSLSTLQSLTNFSTDIKLLQDTQKLLTEACNKGKHVVFIWIPSHQGILGNEDADKAAKDATQLPESTDEPTPYTDAANQLSKVPAETWKQQWNQPPFGKLHAVRQGSTSIYPTKSLTRREQVILTRLRIGHSHITHSYLLTQQPQPICHTCHTVLTIKHLLIECINHTTSRRDNGIPDAISTALDNVQFRPQIFSYLKDTGIWKLL